ncbi:nucleoside triphosphate pyrophosphohydrolase family protein [Aureimonas sp. N4]|uniref:nucleoside triphosphate pyrophosphohydrolase family protein n=1 Tax=Aureimonas sp. N4 TaxID=1638165 RepID=UPI0009EBB916|nr:nucleoside triphosphate pyrophosphohydrolase family protein [Aureimonas sp. N4]
MQIREYQKNASETDSTKRPIVTLFGLIGEVGSLHSIYKKKLRDKIDEKIIRSEIEEEIGDILWYLSSFATLNQIDLQDAAQKNLQKTRDFFGASEAPSFDEEYPVNERFPDHMVVEFKIDDNGRVGMIYEGAPLGDSLSDNSHIEDNYKFHDAYHLAFLAHLHWSPNIRRLLRRKRKSNKAIDENEDGARACAVEEAVAAMVFTQGLKTGFFRSHQAVPLKLVSFLKEMTSNFEVKACNASAWRNAISDGSQAFEFLSRNQQGIIEIDISASTLSYR